MAFGPLLEGRETGLANGMTVSRLVLLQQRDATITDHASGAALAEASCTGGGCRNYIGNPG